MSHQPGSRDWVSDATYDRYGLRPEKPTADDHNEQSKQSTWSVGRLGIVLVLVAILALIARNSPAAGMVLVAGIVGISALLIHWSNDSKV
jgi:uncharacterized membrane protein YkgB